MGTALVNIGGMREHSMVRVLTVGTTMEDHTSLRWIFSHTKWALFRTATTADAMRFLTTYRVGVVLVPENLPDSDDWRFLWEWMLNVPIRPELVLIANEVDVDSWAEALNRGVFDVLPKPLESKDVTWTISSAWLRWKERMARGLGVRNGSPGPRLARGRAREAS